MQVFNANEDAVSTLVQKLVHVNALILSRRNANCWQFGSIMQHFGSDEDLILLFNRIVMAMIRPLVSDRRHIIMLLSFYFRRHDVIFAFNHLGDGTAVVRFLREMGHLRPILHYGFLSKILRRPIKRLLEPTFLVIR